MIQKDKKLSKLLADLKIEYLKEFPNKINRIKKITAQQDWKLIYEEYHKIKGTGKTYGFPEISQICEVLETMAQNKETQKITLFEEAIGLLQEMYDGYQRGETLDLQKHPLAKTLLLSGKTKC